MVVNVVFKDETFWLTQKAMAALFDVNPQAITKHLANIYEDLELEKSATCSILEQVQKERNRSVKRSVEFYNLDAIIAVGYRVNQNKLHFAVSGKTAAELVYNRADAQKVHMGLTNWKNSPDGKIYKSDVTIAKNYLNEKEISRLNRLVTMFIDYAELQAEDGNLMRMQDCIDAVNMFLQSTRQQILESKGKISHDQAVEKALGEYEIFRIIQDREYISEFDRQTKNLKRS